MGRMEVQPYDVSQIYTDGKRLLTKNLTPGKKVYGEELLEYEGIEYRVWNPRRSKLAALILKGTRFVSFEKGSEVLYLGAATGTTASHVSDIVIDGLVYCVEVSHSSFRKLLKVCEARSNMMPLLVDASKPERYAGQVGKVDVLYQDIAQRDQVQIFIKNLRFLKAGGTGYLMIKARSEDVAAKPRTVYRRAREKLEVYNGNGKNGLKVLVVVELEPYEKDHAAFIVRK